MAVKGQGRLLWSVCDGLLFFFFFGVIKMCVLVAVI